jgi:hypothetical protein
MNCLAAGGRWATIFGVVVRADLVRGGAAGVPPGQPPSAETRTARVGGQPSALTSSARWRTRGRPPVPCWVRPRLPLADASVRVAFVAQRANRLAPGVRWRTRATFPGARPHRRAAEPLPPRRAAILPPDSDRLLLAVNPPARVSRSSEGASGASSGPFLVRHANGPLQGCHWPLSPWRHDAARLGHTAPSGARAAARIRPTDARDGHCGGRADGSHISRWPRHGRRRTVRVTATVPVAAGAAPAVVRALWAARRGGLAAWSLRRV